jgi:hypothetical protein
MAVGMYYASQKYYRIDYEWKIIAKISGSALILFFLSRSLGLEPLRISSLAVKLLLLVIFGITLVVIDVVKKEDIRSSAVMLKNIIKKSASRSAEE